MNIEKLKEGDKKKIILKNGMIYSIDITKIYDNIIRGIDKFGQEIEFDGSLIGAIVPISGTPHGSLWWYVGTKESSKV